MLRFNEGEKLQCIKIPRENTCETMTERTLCCFSRRCTSNTQAQDKCLVKVRRRALIPALRRLID